MQLLADGIVRDRYDVVVVGSGIGGLTAAAMLANRGIRVLVIEQHYIPGGCCTCIRRKDVTFDVGAAVFMGCGEIGFTPHHFVMNELEEEIDLIRHEAMYRLHAYGGKVAFWRDLDRFLDELVAMFPKEEKGIQTDGLLEVEAETLQVKGRPGLYAGGDIIRGAGTIVQAVADGRRAAGAIDRMIRGIP